ncbi:MAG: DNA modification methylase [Steroidobacteraceae bacterium]
MKAKPTKRKRTAAKRATTKRPAPAPPAAAMRVEMWPIQRFVAYARNPRKNDHVIDKMVSSIREFGFKIPMLARSDGTIVDGHLRLKGAAKFGLTELPVILCDEWTDAQVKAFRLMVNRSVAWADWDDELLASELGDLSEMDIDLSLTGFDLDEIAGYLASTTEGLTDEDAVPEVQERVVTTLGDVWLLDKHRVMCGDSTDANAVARLMDGAKADMVFTDPPYGVNYEGYTKDKLTIQGDNRSAADFAAFLNDAFLSYFTAVKADASLYVCHSSSAQREFQAAIEAAGLAVRCQIIWAKNTFAWGFARYKFQHEPIFYCHVSDQKDRWYGDKSQSTLWEENKPSANRLHPTMKPVGLVQRALTNSSKPGDVVLDLFGGAGSTLIACEQSSRTAVLMELDSTYCDVIIRRWQQFTGKSAILDGTQSTFDELAHERAAAA